MEEFFYVWCENGNNPTHKHFTYKDACVEAERLARKESGKVFYILKAISSVTIKCYIDWKNVSVYQKKE